MTRIVQLEEKSILGKIRNGEIDAAMLSTTSLVDDIILTMHEKEILPCLKDGFLDKRADNTTIPFYLVMALAIAAKMRVHTSLTKIPVALTSHRTICALGYSLWDNKRDLKRGLMSEGALRFIIDKYTHEDFITGYIDTVQKHIMPKLDLVSHIHILDCTKLAVNLKNENYEGSAVARDNSNRRSRGYKLATLRGIVGDSGIIEDISFGAMNIDDRKLSEEMLKTTPVLKQGDILINDKGFMSRDMLNHLKSVRGVDTYVPLKKNMEAYEVAVSQAKMINKWMTHPNKKRKGQKITFVPNLEKHWRSNNPKGDVPINGCVVWDTVTDEYFVFITTDTDRSAKQIVQTYELRPEIEEDYRQLKDFWKIADFKSTKLHTILFHIVCVLLGYLFFQLYTMMPEGEEYAGKSLPVAVQYYQPVPSPYVVIYSGDVFGVLHFHEIMKIYAEPDLPPNAKRVLDEVIGEL